MPGVVRVITWKDVKGTNRISMPVGRPRGKATGNEQPILVDEKVFRYGDICALVAATTRREAREAAKKVHVHMENLPSYLTLLDAIADDAMEIHEGKPNLYLEQPHFWGEDTEAAFEKAEHVVAASYYTQREPHLALEPDSAFAYCDEDGKLAIHYKSQTLYAARTAIAAGIGLPIDKIRIVANPAGGSFGYTMSPTMPGLVAVAAIALERPCALTLNYEEHQHFTGKRAPSFSNIRLAADSSGKIQAMEYEIAFDTGPYTQFAGSLTDKGPTFMGMPYKIPRMKGLSKLVFTNHNYNTTYRSYGVVSTTFATEMIMEEMAFELGMDPLEFRYINALRENELFSDDHLLDSYTIPEMIDNLRPRYEQAKQWSRAHSSAERRYGVGIACSTYKAGGGVGDQSEIDLELRPDGGVTHYNSWEDMGQGADVGTLVHTHEALRPLGLRPDQIRLVQNDTKYCPNSGAAAGSRSHYMNGLATLDAAKKLMEAMRKEDGSFRSYAEMVGEGIPVRYTGKFSTTGVSGMKGIDPNTGLGFNASANAFAVMMARVEVEVASGKIRVLGIDCEADHGRVGSYQAVEGQALGGITHAIGMALAENYDDIKKDANIMGAGFTFIDMIPDEIHLHALDRPRATGPHGSSGCSEAFQSGPHAAVIAAVHDACGIWIRKLPATPDKVMAALTAAKRGDVAEPEMWYLGCDFAEHLEELKNNPV